MKRILPFATATAVAAATAVGYAFSGLFIAFMFAGGVYKTECTTADGRHAEGWALGDSIPYMWSAGPDCEEHTLTRVLLGKAGVMDEVR